LEALKSEHYQDDPDDIYKTTEADESESGKTETDVYLNRQTWDAIYYGALLQNLTFMSIWDMYEHDCEPNVDTYAKTLAPFHFSHFYDKWYFWLPMTVLAYNYNTYSNDNKTTFHLGNGLTEGRLREDGTRMFYLVGVGEEMIFRGTIQKSMYEYFKETGMSPGASRYSAIFLGAVIFGAAHSGSGFSANPLQAFAAGAFLGWVYQPEDEEFDLITAIAIHSWWDLIIFYTILNHSEVQESEEPVEIPIMKASFQF